MDIKNLSYIEYIYLFEIDNVKRALFLSIKAHNTISKCESLEKSEKRRISKLQKDFRTCCYKLIKRDLSFEEEYIFFAKTLILILSDIRTIIRKERIKYCYEKVYSYLPLSETTLESILNGNITNILVYGIYIILFSGFFGSFVSLLTLQTLDKLIALTLSLAFLIVFSIINLIFNKRFSNSFSIDKLKRIKDRNIYLNSVRNQKSFSLISKIINIIKHWPTIINFHRLW